MCNIELFFVFDIEEFYVVINGFLLCECICYYCLLQKFVEGFLFCYMVSVDVIGVFDVFVLFC